MHTNLRIMAAAGLLVGAALFLRIHNQQEIIPEREPFHSFPHQIGAWRGSDSVIPVDSLAVLGNGDFLLRNYQTASSTAPLVNLFLAYFPSQRTGDTIHSPKHCLPGEGWFAVESRELSLAIPGQAPFPANRYLITKGGQRALVLYWYQAHDRAIASDYKARLDLIADSIRYNRSDGSLIRVSTLMLPEEGAAVAQQRLVSFLTGVMPLLGRYIPH